MTKRTHTVVRSTLLGTLCRSFWKSRLSKNRFYFWKLINASYFVCFNQMNQFTVIIEFPFVSLYFLYSHLQLFVFERASTHMRFGKPNMQTKRLRGIPPPGSSSSAAFPQPSVFFQPRHPPSTSLFYSHLTASWTVTDFWVLEAQKRKGQQWEKLGCKNAGQLKFWVKIDFHFFSVIGSFGGIFEVSIFDTQFDPQVLPRSSLGTPMSRPPGSLSDTLEGSIEGFLCRPWSAHL